MTVRSLWLVGVLLLTTGNLAFAQGTATINGRITDQSGAVVPGVTVTATRTATGVKRFTVTNADGLYSIPALDSGSYDVVTDLQGFTPATVRNVTLTVGGTLTVDVALGMAGVQEQVDVQGAAPLLEVTKSEVKSVILAKEIENVPLLGRNLTNLVLLVPGVRASPTAYPSQQRQGAMSFGGGTRSRNVNVVVDGADNKDMNVGGVLQSYTLESLEEFKVATHRFSAEDGRAAGGVITIVTKTGTNGLHGSGFLFARDESLTAKDYFAKVNNSQEAPFSRQQFGGSFGGPIRKDRAFYFVAVERIREEKAVTLPDKAVQEMQLLVPYGAKPWTQIPRPLRETMTTVKLNMQVGEKHSGALRVAGQLAREINNQGPVNRDSWETTDDQNSYSIVATDNWIINPRALNQVSVQYSQLGHVLDSAELRPVDKNLVFPSVAIGNRGVYQDLPQSAFQFRDDVTVQVGAHALKFGGDFNWYTKGPGGTLGLGSLGDLTFFDDPSVILSDKARYPNGLETPGIVRQFSQDVPARYFDTMTDSKEFAVWLQDDLKATRNLTLNLGVRYDLNFNFYDEGELQNNRTYEVLKAIGSPWASGVAARDMNNVSPRVGFAYQWRDGGTVVRGGYGLYYDQLFVGTNIWASALPQSKATISGNKTLTNTAIGRGELATYRLGIDPPPQGPGVISELPPGGRSTGSWLDPAFEDPYNQQIHVGMSHMLTPTTVLTADFTEVLGRKEFFTADINRFRNGVRVLAPAFGAALGDPNILGTVQVLEAAKKSQYDELSIKVETRRARTTLQGSYTLSFARGHQGQGGGDTPGLPQDVDQPFAPGEWGPTISDERHRVIVSGSIELPYGLQVSPVMQAASAQPYTLLAGVDLNADGTANDRYVDPTTGQQVGVNSQRGDSLFVVDLRVTKAFQVRTSRLNVFAEFFNLFDVANFGGQYNGNARSTLFKQPIALLRQVGYPFQVQLGARIVF